MKYVFFDVECSNCYKGEGKLCEFGYVITDEKFCVLRKDVLPMSPGQGGENRFDKGIYKRDPEFDWAYDIDTYYQFDEYPFFHEKIKSLLEDKQARVFGYSVDNDIRYLDSTIRRYKLNSIQYQAYDVQKMANYFLKLKDAVSLKEAFIQICDKKELVNIEPHLSRDDAYMTMRIVQNICAKLEITFDELVERCPECQIDSEAYLQNYFAQKEKKKDKQRAKTYWKDFCQSQEKYLSSSLKKTYTISGSIKETKKKLRFVVEQMKKRDCIAVRKIKAATYMIVESQEEKEHILESLKDSQEIEFLFYEDLSKEEVPQ